MTKLQDKTESEVAMEIASEIVTRLNNGEPNEVIDNILTKWTCCYDKPFKDKVYRILKKAIDASIAQDSATITLSSN